MREIYVLEDVLNTLIELEVKGYHLYESYKEICNDPALKQLFEELAKAEKKHELFYNKMKEKILHMNTSSIEEEYKEYLDTLISNNFFIISKEFRVDTMEEAINLAERLEKDTILFMNELNGIIGEKAGFREILEEEKRHLLKIYQYKKEYGMI